MQTKNQISLTRKTLNVIMLLGLFFSAFGAGNLPSARAQALKKISLIDGTVISTPEIDSAVILALQTSRVSLPDAQYYAITDITQLSTWRLISTLGLTNVGNDLSWNIDNNSLWAGLILLENQHNSWVGSVEGSQEFSQMLSRIPNDLLSIDAKNDLDPLQRALQAQAVYHFPWTSGTSMKYGIGVVGGIGVHENGFAGVVSGWKAVDFLSGYGIAGEAPNDLHAATAGTVNYKCTPTNGGVTTAIKVNDLFYTHLNNNSSIYVGRTYADGESIGSLKTGDFSENCGSASQGGVGSRIFHVHLGFPNTGSITFDGWTLNVSNGIWTNGSTSKGVYSWFQSGASIGTSCSGPSLNSPSDGYISTNQTVNFSWSAVSGCTSSGYTFRIKDTSNMDSGGNTIVDTGEGNTSRTETIASQWNNKNLYWGVKAANAPNGASWTVRRFVIQPGSAPSTPSNPNPSDYATLSRTNNTNLTWSANGTNCTVHIWGGSIDISPSGGCSSLALGAQRGGAYSWQVNASNSYGNSTGPTWHFNVKPYGASSLNSSVASSSQINLSWILSSDDDGTNVDGYDVYKNGSLVGSVNKGVNTYQATGLACNTGYSFYVLTKRQGIQSDASNTVNATTSACGPASPTLNSPANNATLARTTSIVLSWNTASGATQYRTHFWGGPNIDIWTSWTSGTSWALGSQWGGVYQWSVEASNGSVSSFSETRNLTVLYGTPSSLAAQVNSPTQITIMWYQSADAPGNIDGYRIYRNGAAIATVGSSGITPSYVDSDITCGTLYTYFVRAYKGNLESADSNTASATPSNCPPTMPGNLTVGSATQSSLTLNWQDNSNNETGFNIYRWGYDGVQWTFIYLTTVGSNITSYTQTGLDCGSDFNYYEVSAYNANGESTLAGWVQGTTAACPPSELSIANITFDSVSPFTNDDVWVEVVIQNTSNIPTAGFWTDFYVDATPAGCNDWGSYYGWVNGLAANETFTWRTRIPANSFTSGAHQFRAFVDSGCAVAESSESNNISSATFTLTLPSSAAPAHDDFDSARLVSPISYSDTVDVSGATAASDDPYVPDCGGYGLKPGMTSVWYQYTPSTNESLYLDTFGSSYDTYIAVWSGTRGSLSSVACNDDLSGHGLQSGLPVNLIAGTTYYFEVAEYSDSDSTPVSSASAASLEPAVVVLPTGVPQARRAPSAEAFSLEATAKQQKVKLDVNAQAGGTLQFHATKVITLNTFNSASRWTSAFDLSHGWTVSQYMRTLGDMNGDGKADLVGFGLDGVYVALSTGSGFGSASRWTSAFDLSHGWTVADFVRTVGDVNGDGKADLIGFGLDGVYVALSTGSGFGSVSRWTPAFDLSHGWTVAQYVRTVGDMNGDGKADLIGFGLDGVYVALSTGSGFGSVSRWTTAFDLSHGWTVSQFVRTVGDVNGDGKADLIGFGLDGVYVALSTGNGFGSVSQWTTAFDLSHGWTVSQFVRTVGDINGDDKADLIGFGLDGVYVALSNGVGFIPSSMGTTGFNYSTQGWRVDQHYRTLGDVNGDGKADLVGFGLDGVYVGTAK